MRRRPNPTKSPIILDDFHGKTVPPHCKAGNRQHTAAISSVDPPMSNRLSSVFKGSFLLGMLAFCKSRNLDTKKQATAPMGRFLYLVSQDRKPAAQKDEHPETPSPTCVMCKGSSHNRAKAGCESKHTNDNTKVD